MSSRCGRYGVVPISPTVLQGRPYITESGSYPDLLQPLPLSSVSAHIPNNTCISGLHIGILHTQNNSNVANLEVSFPFKSVSTHAGEEECRGGLTSCSNTCITKALSLPDWAATFRPCRIHLIYPIYLQVILTATSDIFDTPGSIIRIYRTTSILLSFLR